MSLFPSALPRDWLAKSMPGSRVLTCPKRMQMMRPIVGLMAQECPGGERRVNKTWRTKISGCTSNNRNAESSRREGECKEKASNIATCITKCLTWPFWRNEKKVMEEAKYSLPNWVESCFDLVARKKFCLVFKRCVVNASQNAVMEDFHDKKRTSIGAFWFFPNCLSLAFSNHLRRLKLKVFI